MTMKRMAVLGLAVFFAACEAGGGGGNDGAGAPTDDAPTQPMPSTDEQAQPMEPTPDESVEAVPAPTSSAAPIFLEPSLVEPLVGIYDLNGNWNGTTGDQALLEIEPIDEDGVARVLLHDFEEQFGCYSEPVIGTVQPDPIFGDRAFMEGVVPFDDAVLALDEIEQLMIDFFDTFDTDRDGDAGEMRRYLAPPVAIVATDIGPRCGEAGQGTPPIELAPVPADFDSDGDGDLDCDDFADQSEAQRVFEMFRPDDVNGLDADNDGLACEAPVPADFDGNGDGDLDCDDFADQSEAQRVFEMFGPDDVNGLDADNDGLACEAPVPADFDGDGDGDLDCDDFADRNEAQRVFEMFGSDDVNGLDADGDGLACEIDPVQPAAAEPDPIEPVPADPEPIEPAPVDPEPVETVSVDPSPTVADYDSDGNGDVNCSDFSSQAEAQRFFDANGPGDPHRLDRDNDGVACESLS